MKFLAVIMSFFTLLTAMTGGLIMSMKSVYDRKSIVTEKAEDGGETVIDSFVRFQTMDGFGCSAAWWAQEAGKRDNVADIMALLYSREDGIGLNIYRYNVGGGSCDDGSIYNRFNRTEGFMNDDGSLDFSRDAAAQRCLAEALNACGSDMRVTLFCNSAPSQLTINGRTYCDPRQPDEEGNKTNLASENYGAFADFLYDVAEHFYGEGYRVTGVSPVNEPQYDWRAWYNGDGSISAKQEGCYFTPEQTRDLLIEFVKKFKGSRLDRNGVEVEMFEAGEAQPGDMVSGIYLNTILSSDKQFRSANRLLRSYFDTACTHSYWSSAEMKDWTRSFLKRDFPKLDVRCTEYCQMDGDRNTGLFDLYAEKGMSQGLDIEYGVAMAKIITDDLTILSAKEWDWWLGCSFGNYTDGLIYLSESDSNYLELSKRYYCLGNFSKFTTEGSVRVAATSGDANLPCVAFVNPDGTKTVVYVNNTAEDIATAYKTKSATSFILTDATHSLENVDYDANGFTVPAMSVLTMVVEDGPAC